MNANVFLDYAATTWVDSKVLDAMMPFMKKDRFGNPSSHHVYGRDAKIAVDNAREIVAAAINAKPNEIIFTSGGSEANNMAIKCGIIDHRGSYITSKIEHHSVLNACKAMKRLHNMDTIFAENDKNGLVTVADVERAARWNSELCSIMMVNNEIGTIEPIKAIAEYCNDYGILMHTDAVQAFGHIPIDVKDLGVDMLSASGHKIYAPKGIGFLYIREDLQEFLDPLIDGGQQEFGLRASTENVPGIVGLGKATELMLEDMSWNNTHDRKLCERLLSKLSQIPDCHVNCDVSVTDYRHINFRIDGIPAEVMLSMFDTVGVCVSSGSACNSESKEPSHVLKAIGLSDDEANSSIRVSLGKEITKRDTDLFVDLLKSNIEMYKGVVVA